MQIYGISTWSIIVALGASVIVLINLKNMYHLITRKFNEEQARYEMTQYTYAYFWYDSIVWCIFGVVVGLYYALRLNDPNFVGREELFRWVGVVLVLRAIGSMGKHHIDKKYLHTEKGL